MAVGHVTVTWNATALGGSFSRYLIYRGGVLVAQIDTEATVSWTDYEARQGVVETYTIKVLHTNGTTSLPATSDTATVTAGTGWWFTSNHDPSINVELFPLPAASFALPKTKEYAGAFGRDYVIAAVGDENRGDRVALTIEISASGGVTTQGRSMFDAVVALRDADVPYVCVTDPYGHRWFVDVTVGDAAYDWPTLGKIPVLLTETTGTPEPTGTAGALV